MNTKETTPQLIDTPPGPVQAALEETPMIFSHHSLDSILDSDGSPVQGPDGELTMVELLAWVRLGFPGGCEQDLLEALDWFDTQQPQS